MKTNIILSVILALAVSAFFIWKNRNQPYKTVDNFLQKTTLTDMGGEPLDKDHLKDKVTILSCFQTWCSDCVKEQPGLLKLQERFEGRIEVIMVSDEPVELMLKFRDKFNSPFTFYHSSVKLRPDMDIKHFPTTFLINRSGNIKEAKIMSKDWYTPETITMIEQLLAQ